AIIEFARNVLGKKQANSTEFNLQTDYPIVALVTEWINRDGATIKHHEKSDIGGTMRLGGQRCQLQKGTLVHRLYGKDEINERHRHRYEVNNTLVTDLEQVGLTISGRSLKDNLVETIEYQDHPWFIGCQFHPEFTSNPRDGHPLFIDYIRAASDCRRARKEK